MDNYTISEYFTLPSQGLVYDKQVVPEVHLSSMTTRHEMQRLAPSKSPNKPMCDVIDDCIVEDIGISAYDMCSGDYQFLMYKLRIVTYGKDMVLEDVCPFCGDKSKVTIDLNLMQNNTDVESFNKYRTFVLPRTGKEITLNYQTPRLMDSVVEHVKEFSSRTNKNQADQSLAFVLKGLIQKIDGKVPDPLDKEEWIRELPMMDTNTIIAYSEKMDNSIGVNTELEIECDRCGRVHRTLFKPGPEFFRPEVFI